MSLKVTSPASTGPKTTTLKPAAKPKVVKTSTPAKKTPASSASAPAKKTTASSASAPAKKNTASSASAPVKKTAPPAKSTASSTAKKPLTLQQRLAEAKRLGAAGKPLPKELLEGVGKAQIDQLNAAHANAKTGPKLPDYGAASRKTNPDGVTPSQASNGSNNSSSAATGNSSQPSATGAGLDIAGGGGGGGDTSVAPFNDAGAGLGAADNTGLAAAPTTDANGNPIDPNAQQQSGGILGSLGNLLPALAPALMGGLFNKGGNNDAAQPTEADIAAAQQAQQASQQQEVPQSFPPEFAQQGPTAPAGFDPAMGGLPPGVDPQFAGMDPMGGMMPGAMDPSMAMGMNGLPMDTLGMMDPMSQLGGGLGLADPMMQQAVIDRAAGLLLDQAGLGVSTFPSMLQSPAFAPMVDNPFAQVAQMAPALQLNTALQQQPAAVTPMQLNRSLAMPVVS